MPQDCQVGLNFACEKEAEVFRNVAEEKINQRSNRQGQLLSFLFIFYMNFTKMITHKTEYFISMSCLFLHAYLEKRPHAPSEGMCLQFEHTLDINL